MKRCAPNEVVLPLHLSFATRYPHQILEVVDEVCDCFTAMKFVSESPGCEVV
jgi:hypothetical protein